MVVLDQEFDFNHTFGPITLSKRHQTITAVLISPSDTPAGAMVQPHVAIYRPSQTWRESSYIAGGIDRIYHEFSIPPGRYMVTAVGDGKWRLTITETSTPPR